MRCVACGSDDRTNYGFCTICGEIQPQLEWEAYAMSESEGGLEAARQLGRNMAIALFFIFLTMVFLAMYLSYLDARWEIIVLVESFPLFWFMVILMHWRRTQAKIHADSDEADRT